MQERVKTMKKHPFTQCYICGEKVWKCEIDSKTGVALCGNSKHKYGCQLNNGKWVCSELCWEKAAALSERETSEKE